MFYDFYYYYRRYNIHSLGKRKKYLKINLNSLKRRTSDLKDNREIDTFKF